MLSWSIEYKYIAKVYQMVTFQQRWWNPCKINPNRQILKYFTLFDGLSSFIEWKIILASNKIKK